MTIVKNSLQLVEKVMEARGISRETVRCRDVINGGQGLVKNVASILTEVSTQSPRIKARR